MKIVLGALIGGIVGFAVGYFGKCTSGACPLTGNPLISTIIGALIGALIATAK
jgi:presenilin-like A22 family membrane protease